MGSICRKICPDDQKGEQEIITVPQKQIDQQIHNSVSQQNNHESNENLEISKQNQELRLRLQDNPKSNRDTYNSLCNINFDVNFNQSEQILREQQELIKRQKRGHGSLNLQNKKEWITRYSLQSTLNNQNQEKDNKQQSLKYQLIIQKQPGKDYLIEPNSYYQGYFDIQKGVKQGNGKIIVKSYDSHFNQSFFTYEGPFQMNKCIGSGGKQFYGKSKVIQFEGEWNSQGKIESTGKFFDGAGNQIPNPYPKINKNIKIISITDTRTGNQTSPKQQLQNKQKPSSWCAYDQLYYERDLQILQGNSWLNSSIIDGYINFLNYKDQEIYWEEMNRKDYKRTLIIASSVFSKFHENSIESNRQYFQDEFYEFEPIQYRFWKIFKKIAIVINQNNSHWYFVILDFTSKIMIIQDSMRGMKNHYRLVKKILEELFSDEEVKIEFEIKVDYECPQQNNGYDCGAYVCMNAKLLFLSEKSENQTKSIKDQIVTNPKMMRNELYEFIRKFQDNE